MAKEQELGWRKTGVAPDGYIIVPADGRWAWMVLIGSYMCGMSAVIPIVAFATTMNDVMATFQINTATVSWTLASYTATYGVVGPLATVISRTLSSRRCVLAGSLFFFVSITLSAFVTNIGQMIFTFGILGGIGSGLLYVPLTVVLSSYFDRHFGVASGVFVSAFSMGKLVLTPFADYLISSYSWRGCMLIMGALILHACVGAALFQPPKWHWRLSPAHMEPLLQKNKRPRLSVQLADKETPMTSFKMKLRSAMDPTLFKEPSFYAYSVTYCIIFSVAICFSGFLFTYGLEAGLLPTEAAWFASSQAIGELVGRMGGMVVIKVFRWPIVPTFALVTAAASVTFVGVTLVTSRVPLYLTVGVSGLLNGACVGMIPSLVLETVGMARLLPTMGYSVLIQGVSVLALGPFGGWLRDVNGNYNLCFITFGCLVAFVALLWMVIWLVKRHSKPYGHVNEQPIGL